MNFGISRRKLLCLIGAMAMAPEWLVAATETLLVQAAEGRMSRVSVWRAQGKRRGTILFSHGAQSSPAHYSGLIGPWVTAGYDVLAPLHVDSIDHPETAKFIGFASWRARLEDMRALAMVVSDQRYIAAGHSYGALVALTLGGASAVPPAGLSGSLRDPRVGAVVAFSPPAPIPNLITAEGYATLAVPALIQTGDRDVFPGDAGEQSAWKKHLAAFDAAEAGGNRYALVLAGVDHYFGGLICNPKKTGPDQSRQLQTAAELATLFLDAYGRGEAHARQALNGYLSASGEILLRSK